MTNAYHNIFSQCYGGGEPFVQVTLVDVIGSTPQDQGAKMMVNGSGLIVGTVGGGRVENKAIEHAQNLIKEKKRTDFVEWHLKTDVGMTCGGIVKLFFEVFNEAQWKIAIFGAGHVAQALVRALLPLPCVLTCLDTRQAWLDQMPTQANLKKIHTDDLAQEVAHLDPASFIVVMTQGHKTDVPILARILKREPFPFLGVIGSNAKAGVMRQELVSLGIPPDRAEGFLCPVGLKLGNNSPPEIAISIAAQLLQRRDEISHRQ